MFFFSGGGEFGSRVVSRARQDLGRTEQGGNNRGAVVQELMRGTGYGQGAAWCAGAATNWTNDAAQGTLGRKLVHSTARVSEMMGDYRRAGAFSAFNGDLSNVSIGDQVFFQRQGGGHVGIVTSNSGSRIGIIEGNVSLGGGNADGRAGAVDGVYEATWGVAELQQRAIIGFGHNEVRYQKAMGRQPERAVGSRNEPQAERGGHGAQQAAMPSFFSALFGGANHQAEQQPQAEQKQRHGRRAERQEERGGHGAQQGAPSFFAGFFGGASHQAEQQRPAEQKQRHGRRAERQEERNAHGTQQTTPSPFFAGFFAGAHQQPEPRHPPEQPKHGRRKHAAGQSKDAGGQHVDHTNLGGFSSPFGAFFTKPPQGHSKG